MHVVMPTTSPPEWTSEAGTVTGYRFGCEGLMSVNQAAEFLAISRWTLARKIEEGRIRRGRDGRRVVICRRSVIEYAASLEV